VGGAFGLGFDDSIDRYPDFATGQRLSGQASLFPHHMKIVFDKSPARANSSKYKRTFQKHLGSVNKTADPRGKGRTEVIFPHQPPDGNYEI
jgi:hypothetical protein